MLVDTTIARPALGGLIKSLHIGPNDPLPDDWWPIIDRKTLCIHLNALPKDRSASWWSSGPHHHPISIERPLDVNCLSRARRALEAAVDEASGSLDVDLRRFSYNRTGSIMNTQFWHCAVFEVYAAAELYMMEMSRYEARREDAGQDVDPPYPQLLITDGPPQPAQPYPAKGHKNNTFTLTRAQLLNRLAAPGTRTDRFDHPLLFARTEAGWDAAEASGDFPRAGMPSPPWGNDDEAEAISLDVARNDYPLPRTATVGGILSLTRSLLAQAPCIKSLSLTGFLERAVCGSRVPAQLPMLRSLSLGPPTGTWCQAPLLRFSKTARGSIERLRICGHLLSKEEAIAIVSSLPRLQLLKWTHTMSLNTHEVARLWDAARELIGLGEDASSSASPKRSRISGHEGNDSSSSQPTLLIEAHFHPASVAHILDRAPTPAIRVAWSEGLLPSQDQVAEHRQRHRFHVREVHVNDSQNRNIPEVYEEGNQWFEESVEMAGVRE